jgi:hypothetical protein
MRDDIAGLNQEEPMIEWYLARNGQKDEPLTEIEMEKFNQLGHLRANDLV